MGAIVMFLGITAAIWGCVILRRGGLIAGALSILLAGTCFGHAFYSLPISPIPFTIDRFLWVLVLGQFVLLRRFGSTTPKPLQAADYLLGAFILALSLNVLTGDWAANNNLAISRLLFYYIMPLGIYWIGRQTQLTEKNVRWIYGAFALIGLYMAFTAVAEVKQWWGLVYPTYIASTTVTSEYFGRGRGPLLNPAGSGIYQAVCWFAALMFWPKLGRRGQLALIILSLVYLIGIYATLTRSAWMGAILGLAVLIWLPSTRSWRFAFLISGTLAATLVLSTQWSRIVSFKRDTNLSARETADSVKLRPILARVAWNMFQDRPLLGCGFSHYLEEQVDYLNDRTTSLPLYKSRHLIQHNALLSLLTETGLVGVGIFVSVCVLWIRSAWRLWKSSTPWRRQWGIFFLASFSAYFINGMFHDVSIIPMVHMVMFYLAGITVGGDASESSARSWQTAIKRGEHSFRLLQPAKL